MDIPSFGMKWPPGIPLIQRHQYCAYHDKGFGAFFHRKERIKALWPDFQWHRWNERRLQGLCRSKWVTWLGPGSCVSGTTRIFDPISRENPTIKELHDQNRMPCVLTLYGCEKAGVPFIKGVSRLYRVRISNGGMFEATQDHRVLTPTGYRRVGDLSTGDVLAGAGLSEIGWVSRGCESLPIRPHSTSGGAHSIREPDVPSFRKKAEDCPDGYSICFCLDGGQPHSVVEIDQSFAPLQADVQGCMECACAHLGVPDKKLHDNHLCLQSLLPSIPDFSLPDYSSSVAYKSQHVSRNRERDAYVFPPQSQFLPTTHLPTTFEELSLDARDTDWFCGSYARRQLGQSYGVTVSDVVVESITRTEIQPFYDLTVPFAHHYFAEGAIHHNSGKSTDAAVFGLEFWLQAPDRTAVVVCSTTMKLLRMRIWNEFARYHARLPKNIGPVGELLDSDTRIRWKKGDNVAGVFGMAVEEGPVEEIIHNLIGLHPVRYLLILDEAQGVREAIMRATTNMAKNQWFGALLMGNPDDMNNPLLRESEPVDGWGNMLERAYAGEVEEWETLGGPTKGRGLCQFFDGRKSPADDSPDERKRLPWLINAEWVADHLKGVRGNTNDPSFWSQAIGLPPPMGVESTVLDVATIQMFHCRDKAIWTHGFVRWASLDPSFEGGDKCVLTIGQCGETEHGGPRRWQIGISEQLEVPINAKSEEPLHYQITRWVMEALKKRQITPAHFALDSSGEGGGLKSIFEREWGPVIGIEFGGSPSLRQLPNKPDKTAKDEYDRRSTELNFNVREFALADGLRGLPERAAIQFCARKTYFKNRKYCVEPKTIRKGTGEKGFKQRLGYSPDESDSVAIGVALCMQELGAEPSLNASPGAQTEDDWTKKAAQAAREFNEENYLQGYDFGT